MTRALQHLCLTNNKLAYERLKEQILDAAATLDGVKEPEPDAPPSLEQRTYEDMKFRVQVALANADVLLGERLGMLLVLMPESDDLNARIEQYIAKHKTTKPVVDGMAAMKNELQHKREKQIQEATKNATPVAGQGSSGSPDARHRSRHHNFLRKNYSAGVNRDD
ncbi:hypothetical protein SAMN05443245_5863 [Paraburkholderia fungorum]|uniref:Uncharacterized protein n=1 Tax=Paraburkholderia fungorum TaxID=134537 RepID=A0A1H1IXZ3_9BURK|nr:hypothetical protein [Paraburkholderia fungorum]SDR42595.1 hypothetical protein SAMN05443245_5863 [Paraburkholderia fungorum]